MSSCDLYLINSKIPNSGKGIVFGNNSKQRGQILTSVYTIEVPYAIVESWSLSNYVFSYEPSTCIIAFGEGMLFNHMKKEKASLTYHWNISNTNYLDFYTQHSVLLGEELFISYGTNWFESRGLDFVDDVGEAFADNIYHTDEELTKNGHCLSDIYVTMITSNNSHIERDSEVANVGVFSNRYFEVGEVVSLSPVLLASKSDLIEAIKINPTGEPLLHRCIGHPDSDVLLLPLGRAALLRRSGSTPNVRINWNYTDAELNLDSLWNLPYAPLELQYIAIKLIHPSEELFLDIGHAHEASQETIKESILIAPDNLFPQSWRSVPTHNDSTNSRNEL